MILELGQFFSQFEWIRVTTEYSNAVLVAVLPYVNDAAQKLDLPVPHPITAEHLTYFEVAPRRALTVGIGVRGEKGEWRFGFGKGYVDTIQGPHSYFSLQDPDEIPKYYGEVRMSKAEAIQFARSNILNLGIPLESVYAEQEPRVREPEKIGTNTVPHYRIEWLDPRSGVVACVDMDIDANARQLARLRIFNKNLERPPPKIEVVPPRHPNSPHWPLANAEYAWKLIPIVLRAVDEYGQTLGLPLPRPLTTNHVARFELQDNIGRPHCELKLTNGWRFIYRDSMVNGYYAPDNLFNSDDRPILIKEFVGQWNLTEAEASALIRRTLAKLNYPTNLVRMDFKPHVAKPSIPGIPRYDFWWWCENETHDDLVSKVEAEVDTDKRELKSLYFEHRAFWNQRPPIDVPISLPVETNATPARTSPPPKSFPKPPPRTFAPVVPLEKR